MRSHTLALAATAAAGLALTGSAHALTMRVSEAAPFPVPMYGGGLVTLDDGRVLLVGGFDGTWRTENALYDPDTDTWTESGEPGGPAPLPAPRAYASVTTIPSGDVLVFGGRDASTEVDTILRYDPDTDVWSTLAETTPAPDMAETSAVFGDGRVLLAGGGLDVRADAFDPVTGAWSPLPGSGPAMDGFSTATELPDGRILVVNDLAGEIVGTDGTWTPVSAGAGRNRGDLVTLRSGRVLYIGGALYGTAVPLPSLRSYDPSADAWQVADAGDLGYGSMFAAATRLADGRVLVVGGQTTGLASTANARILDPVIPAPVDDAAAVTAGGSTVADVLANDTNLQDGPHTVSIVAPPAAGAATVEGTSIRLSAPAVAGTQTLRYRVTDADGDTGEGTLTVDVQAAPPAGAAPSAPSTGPAAAPADTTPPALTGRLSRSRRALSGTASDASGVARVEARVVRRLRTGCKLTTPGLKSADARCASLSSRWPLRAVLTGGTWRLPLGLRPGRYTVAVRAVDAAGNASAPMSFSVVRAAPAPLR